MTDHSSITKPMIRRIWWAQTWRSYIFMSLCLAVTLIVAYLGNFYTVECFQNHCRYAPNAWLILLDYLIIYIAIPTSTYWLALNRTYTQITIDGTNFTTSVALKNRDSLMNKAKAMLRFFWAFNWRYVPIIVLLSICIVVMLDNFMSSAALFSIICFIIIMLLAIYQASIQILTIVLSKKFKNFEICIT